MKTDPRIEQLLRDMERFGRQRQRPDKWRAKFRATMRAAIKAFEDGSPLSDRDTWRVVCYLRAAHDAYAPDKRPAPRPTGYRAVARRRVDALVAEGKSTAAIVHELAESGISEASIRRYIRAARKT